MRYKEEFIKWLNDNLSIISVTVDNYNQNKILSNINELSTYFKKDIFSINDVSEIEYLNLCLFHDDKETSSKMGVSLTLYKQFLITTYMKKENIDKYIHLYENYTDINEILVSSEYIYKYFCTWPTVYLIMDKNDKYVTQIVKNKDHNELCYLLYTSKDKIDPSLLKDNKVLEIKSNIFFFEIDNDDDNHASAIVVNPNFYDDKVFISTDELVLYYDPVLCSSEFN